MAIIFSNNKSIQEIGNKLTVPGRIVQTVHTIYTGGFTTSSTSPVDVFTSNTITMLSASNTLLIEWHCDTRTNDWYDNNWNLYYQDIVHVQSSTQISYTGYIGEYTQNIRSVHRVGRHAPGSVGPHSYKVRCWSYAALITAINNPGGVNTPGNDGRAYIRISEIAAA